MQCESGDSEAKPTPDSAYPWGSIDDAAVIAAFLIPAYNHQFWWSWVWQNRIDWLCYFVVAAALVLRGGRIGFGALILYTLLPKLFAWWDGGRFDAFVYSWGRLGFSAAAWSTVFLALALRPGVDRKRIGFATDRLSTDAFVAIVLHALFVALGVAASKFILEPLHVADLGFTFPQPDSSHHHLVLLAASCANGFGEELVLRGWMIPRMESAGWSSRTAVLTTSVIFAGYHLYQGWSAAIEHGLWSVAVGVMFVKTRRLAPCVIAHILGDWQPENVLFA